MPTYIHRVPSFNAANVWMMRSLADILDTLATADEGAQLRAQADTMATAVMGLYVPGSGVWSSLHRDGTRVEMRHCYDFASVGRFMPADLPQKVRKRNGRLRSAGTPHPELDACTVSARRRSREIRSPGPWPSWRLRRVAGRHR